MSTYLADYLNSLSGAEKYEVGLALSSALTPLKRAMLSFGGAGNGAASPGTLELLTRLPVKLVAPTVEWRLRIANVAGTPQPYDRATTFLAGAVPFSAGVWLGPAVMGADGEPTGAASAMNQALGAFSTSADGSDYVTPWVTDPALQFPAQIPFLLSYGWLGTGIASMGTSNCKYYYRAGAGKLGEVGTANPGAFSSSTANWLDVRLEYKTAGQQSVILLLGDSLSEPKFSTNSGPGWVAWHQQAALQANAHVICTARGGQDTVTFSSPTAWEWARLGTEITPDAGVVFLGSNDASVTGTPSDTAANRLANYQARMGVVLGLMKSKFNIDKVALCTPPPRGYTATILEPTRTSIVSWLKGAPYGAAGVIDFDSLLRDPADFTNLAAAYKGSDAIHWPVAAHSYAGAAAAGAFANLKRT